MTQVFEPFPIFYDDDGTPLENGMIYVGEVNQDARTNPVTVYADDALTITIAQPIRTLAGRPAYQGAPTNLYIAEGAYSITVLDKKGALVVSELDVSVSVGNFSFIQAGIGAVGRSALSKMRDTVSPEDFGAVAVEDGGTTSQSTAILNALQSGRIVDGNGKTYVIGASVNPSDNSVAGIVNCNFVRLAANQSAQDFMINLVNQSDVLVDNCEFDFGTTEDTGTDDDSSRALLAVGSNNTDSATWVRGVSVSNCRFTGDGNGTALFARGLIGARIIGNEILNRVTESATATNDNQNGIDLSWGRLNIVANNVIDGLYLRVSGNLLRQYSRGILLTEQSSSVVSGNAITNCDQGIDCSGGISASLPNGNTGCVVSCNTVRGVRTWGIKFANSIRNTYCGGNVVRNFGFGGIVFSGQSAAWSPPAPTKATSYLTIEGNYIFDPSDFFNRTDCIGIWGSFNASFPGYPVGVRILNNTIRDETGGGRLLHGVALTDTDQNLVSGAPYNEVRGNRVFGQTGTPTKGCAPDGLCLLTGTSVQSIPNTTDTGINWDVERADGEAMHSTSVNQDLIAPTTAGWYLIKYTVVFAANSTGVRKAGIYLNGNLAGGADIKSAVASETIPLTGSMILHLVSGDSVGVDVWQNSGGALNIDRTLSQFSARRIEQMGAS